MTVAVTGSTGQLGAAVVRALIAEGHDVRAFYREDRQALAGLDVQLVRGSVEDPLSLRELVTGCDAVIHLAARISLNGDRQGEVYRTNVLGTRLVLEACRSAGVRRMVHFASVHAFEPPWGRVFDESAHLAGERAFAYDRSKAQALREVREAGLLSMPETVILCPTAVLGPWDFKPSRQGRLLLDLAQGRLPLLPRGGFDWVDSRDVGQAAVSALTKGASGQPYLLSGRYADIREVAELVGNITGKPVSAPTAPDLLLNLTAGALGALGRITGREPALTREALAHLRSGHRNIDSGRAAAELGFKARPLEETLADTLAWFTRGTIPQP